MFPQLDAQPFVDACAGGRRRVRLVLPTVLHVTLILERRATDLLLSH